MTSERKRLVERRDLVTRDLEELAEQQDLGEVDPDTAARLRAAYKTELDSLEASLADFPEEPDERPATPPPDEAPAPTPATPARPVSQIVKVSLVIVVVLTGAIFLAARGDGSGDQTTVQSAPGESPGELTVDPNAVSSEQLEAIVAANPDIVGMRMALADRYFEDEDYGSALDHYLYIAENAGEAVDEAQALARIGWMAYRTGLHIEADEYVRTSLELDPSNAEAALYRGFITMYGLEDVEAAIPQLEDALELPNLSVNVVAQINDALEEARGRTP
ncbi:MAG: tetratricopeptide repeat protein [Acidimicrobiia bacterium]|nr:tetratricopeptide repeat protein [Acidimicrobiia bacterium]NNF68564.1 tetratricopeptide repeat protein [Acidimicrobiia bacterium]